MKRRNAMKAVYVKQLKEVAREVIRREKARSSEEAERDRQRRAEHERRIKGVHLYAKRDDVHIDNN